MTSFEMDIQGLEEHLDEVESERDRWAEPSGTWAVGTAVNYSLFVEYGTSKMDARPFFRPALAEAERDLSAFVRDNTETSLQNIDGPQELVKTIAFALERRIKQIITEKELIDTGALRASVAAVRTESELKGRSDVAARSDVELNPEDFQ